MTTNNKIFITSGGTGGHIIPARCLANHLSLEDLQKGAQIIFLGDKKYRNYIQADDNFKSKIINSSQLERTPLRLIKAIFKIGIGVIQSLYYFIIHRPKLVVAFGGYSTFPILVMAVITKTKIIIHEQNSHLGKVNRIFAKYADKIALSFAETTGISENDQKKCVFTGNPVRNEIINLNQSTYKLPEKKKIEEPTNKMGYDVVLASDFQQNRAEENNKDPKSHLFNILVIGGSGGAEIFSRILPQAFFNLSDSLKSEINIMQQCRKELIEETFNQYRKFNLNGEIKDFFSDMPEKIQKAHLIIARAGSSSIFEFCSAKKPMILIPFARSADNHQKKNADFLKKNNAAMVIEEKDFDITKIGKILNSIIASPKTLKKMSEAAASLAIIDATKNLAKLVQNND